jgi:hypothetical protein
VDTDHWTVIVADINSEKLHLYFCNTNKNDVFYNYVNDYFGYNYYTTPCNRRAEVDHMQNDYFTFRACAKD